MTSSEKANGGDSQEGEERVRVFWMKEDIDTFVDLCNQLLERNTGNLTPRLPWKKVEGVFQKATKKPWDKAKLKNKYDWLRSKWCLWKQLKEKAREDRFGWVHEKGTIGASDGWWNSVIKENSKFDGFRREGIEPELEKKLDRLFGHLLTSGGKLSLPQHLPHTEVDGRGYVSSPAPINYAPPHNLPLVCKIEMDAFNGHNSGNLNNLWEDILGEPAATSTSTSDCIPPVPPVPPGFEENRKRKDTRGLDKDDSSPGKRSRTSSKRTSRKEMDDMLANILKSIKSRNNIIANFVQSLSVANIPAPPPASSSASSQHKEVMSVSDAVTKISSLDLVHGSPEFSFAVTMIRDHVNREILGCMPSDMAIVEWIKFMYAERKGG